MVAPAVIAGGIWAYRAYRLWRAAQAIAATQAVPAATAGVLVGGTYVASEAISGAEEDAQATPVPTTDVCTTCPPPPGCGPLNDEIRALRDELEGRFRDMRIDSYDLFNQAFSRSTPLTLSNGARIGSWEGHVDQFRQKQTRLRRKTAEAREAGCPIDTPDADRWGSIDPPARPG